MSSSLFVEGQADARRAPAGTTREPLTVHPLAVGEEPEVLAFLARRPLHTVVMAGFVMDHGLESPLNRGAFYGCRAPGGQLEGVALLGHATLLEARAEAALDAFGRLARSRPRPHVIMGEREVVARFWRRYAGDGESPRLSCRELLCEQRPPVPPRHAVRGLRLATPAELDAVMEIQARMAFEECGVNPLEADPAGFRARCRRRIELGRVWVLARAGRLVFKADVIAETPAVVYLEGVHVAPERRRAGLGLDCLSQLGRTLLARAGSLCLLVREERAEAYDFYRRAGYEFRGFYDTIYPAR
jgi:hypothetical protein